MIFRLMLVSFIFFITSCFSPQIEFEPFREILPDASVGVTYNQGVIIGTNLEGNPEFLTAENTKIDIYPADIGLQVVSNKTRRDGLPIYNFFISQVCHRSQDWLRYQFLALHMVRCIPKVLDLIRPIHWRLNDYG